MQPTEILKKYWDGNLPLDIVKIADNLEIKLKPDETLKHSALVKPDKTIYYNPNDKFTVKRFAVLNAMYYCLFVKLTKDKIIEWEDLNYKQKDHNKKQANNFAMQLLIPKMVIEFLLYKKFIYDFEELGKIFGSSKNAIMFRLIDLKIIK